MGRFPKITLHDNVRLQHKLVTDTLGLQTLRLVTGCSMGACQAYKWAAQYPDLVRAGAPIAGSARTASNNKVFLSLRRALELDPAFRAGFYDRPPSGGLRAFAAIYAGWGLSDPFYRKAAFTDFSAHDHEEFVAYFWEPIFQKCDANDLLSQLWTWEKGDISDNPMHRGDYLTALRAIQARTIILPVDLDRYFPPEDAQFDAEHIPNAEYRITRSDWGHMAAMNPGNSPGIDAALRDLLEA